jgi:Leucine-rich repeat (LRR) protein
LNCSENRLTEIKLKCPLLNRLLCVYNNLTDLSELVYCKNLSSLVCSPELEDSVNFLRTFIPNLKVEYYPEKNGK